MLTNPAKSVSANYITKRNEPEEIHYSVIYTGFIWFERDVILPLTQFHIELKTPKMC